MTSRTPAQITSDILAKLAVTAPGLSLEVGTPERKIVEAVAEAIAEVQVDNYITSTQLDIDTKTGKDLDDFVGIFGFGRQQGNFASGFVTLTLNIPATQTIYIPTGTQFSVPSTQSSGTLAFASTLPANFSISDVSETVAVQCTVAGSAGNVASGAITTFSAGLGVSSAINSSAMTGGTDSESDEDLRARFKATLLRNISGTTDFYLALGLQVSGVTRAKVIGPVNTYTTQIQSTGGSTVLPSKNCKYVWSGGNAVSTQQGSGSQQWYTEGSDYTVNSGVLGAPTIIVNAGIIISPATSIFLDVEYEYNSVNSRNDPASGICNKVDLFVDGTILSQVTEQIIINTITLDNTTGSPYNIANFISSPLGTTLTTSSKFQRFGSCPIVNWPATITLGATTYSLGTNYVGVKSTTTDAGSNRELSGIVWITTPPANGSAVTVSYGYNQIPAILNAILKGSKQITSDALAHSANTTQLGFNFVVMYNQGASVNSTNSQIAAAVQSFINSLPFGAWIQLSDLTSIVHGVSGVDNCRMAKTADGAAYTASEMLNGVSTGTVYTADFQIADNAIAQLFVPSDVNSMFIRRSFNNFGS